MLGGRRINRGDWLVLVGFTYYMGYYPRAYLQGQTAVIRSDGVTVRAAQVGLPVALIQISNA